MSKLLRRIIEELYYWSALYMPLWFEWQWQYVMDARVYFEYFHEGDFRGWPHK